MRARRNAQVYTEFMSVFMHSFLRHHRCMLAVHHTSVMTSQASETDVPIGGPSAYCVTHSRHVDRIHCGATSDLSFGIEGGGASLSGRHIMQMEVSWWNNGGCHCLLREPDEPDASGENVDGIGIILVNRAVARLGRMPLPMMRKLYILCRQVRLFMLAYRKWGNAGLGARRNVQYRVTPIFDFGLILNEKLDIQDWYGSTLIKELSSRFAGSIH